jgi:beta-lactamase regulating signal transducer with metallopeptidase domain
VLCLWNYCRRSKPIDDFEVRELLDELAGKFTLRCGIDVRELASADLSVAATAGWRRPIILLPPAWRKWSPQQLRAVMAHELAHIAQQHFSILVLSQLPLVAHYYHPLVHWLVRRLRLEQELAADELAANVFGQ